MPRITSTDFLKLFPVSTATTEKSTTERNQQFLSIICGNWMIFHQYRLFYNHLISKFPDDELGNNVFYSVKL